MKYCFTTNFNGEFFVQFDSKDFSKEFTTSVESRFFSKNLGAHTTAAILDNLAFRSSYDDDTLIRSLRGAPEFKIIKNI